MTQFLPPPFLVLDSFFSSLSILSGFDDKLLGLFCLGLLADLSSFGKDSLRLGGVRGVDGSLVIDGMPKSLILTSASSAATLTRGLLNGEEASWRVASGFETVLIAEGEIDSWFPRVSASKYIKGRKPFWANAMISIWYSLARNGSAPIYISGVRDRK